MTDKQPAPVLDKEDKLHQDDHTPNTKKERPGVDPKNPTNADYDYRADHGDTGGGAEHNPEVDDQLVEENEKAEPRRQRKG